MGLLRSTDGEMIFAWNVTNVHRQDFVANDKLLLPMLKAFAQYAHSLHTTQTAVCTCISPLFLPITVQLSPASWHSPPPQMDHFMVCEL